MSAAVRIAFLVGVTAIVQVSIFAPVAVAGGAVDVLLVTVVCVALARRAVAGAVAGFFGGLLVDTATLGTLGFTALLLTVAGYWAGRYVETTGQGRPYATPLTVGVMTVLVALGGLGLHYMLGDAVTAHRTFATLLPTIALNLVAAWPLARLCRVLLRPTTAATRAPEAQPLG
jgi:rod shape-determining protein MreD